MREKSIIPELLREIVAKGESLNVDSSVRSSSPVRFGAVGSSRMPCQPIQSGAWTAVDPHILSIASTSYVFVTARRWPERLGIKKESRLQRNDGKVSRRMLERIRLG